MMTTHSVEQQIANLRPSARSGLATNFHNWLLASAAVLVMVSVVLWNPIPLMIAIFLGVVALAERRAGPNIAAAVEAYEQTNASLGEVSITVSCWDTDDHYHALVREDGHSDWEYEFVPQGWQPTVGSYSARIWRADDGHPILAAVESGILIPRYAPTQPASRDKGKWST